MPKLDDLDKNILSMLQDDARISLADVARKVKVSEGTVHLRIKKMRKMGVIKGFYTIIAPDKVGKNLTAFIFVKADPVKYPNVLDSIIAMGDVYEIYDVTGEFYAVLKVRTNDMKSLTKLIDEMGAIKGIVSTQTLVVLRAVKETTHVNI
ncbi:MAG TPA: Lrp/AsnC family transcriptional regulator [archaeon]|nr:Lrp/AsnC family transcriptional regulator [archaeon]